MGSKTKSYLIGLALLFAGLVSGQTQFVQTGFATLVGGAVMED